MIMEVEIMIDGAINLTEPGQTKDLKKALEHLKEVEINFRTSIDKCLALYDKYPTECREFYNEMKRLEKQLGVQRLIPE
jgi:uncharacterized protein (UPF0128 family)